MGAFYFYQLEVNDLSSLGGPMGTENPKLLRIVGCQSLALAMREADKDYYQRAEGN